MKNQKYRAILVLFLALILSAMPALAGCGGGGQNAAQTGESASASEPEEEAAASESEAPPVSLDELPALATAQGQRMVSDGEHLYFTVSSTGEIYSANYEVDGLYRANPDMGEVTRLVRGNCGGLYLDGDKIYFYNRGPLDDGVGCVDTAGTEMKWLQTGLSDIYFYNVTVHGNKAYYVQYDRLFSIDLTGEETEPQEVELTSGNVTWAQACEEGVYYSALSVTDNSWGLYLYLPDVPDVVFLGEPSGYGFAPMGDKIYYLGNVPNQPETEDYTQYESEIMRTDREGNAQGLGVTGRFCGGILAYGQYLFYCKYTDVQEIGGSDEEKSLSRPYCYDTATGVETAITRDEFIGWDVRLTDVSGGLLYCELYSGTIYDPGEFVEALVCPIAGEEDAIRLVTAVEGAPNSDAVNAVDLAEEEEAARRAEEQRKEEEEREKEREEEYKNEPYGPGTSTLYLKAGSLSACYRLVRLDGSTEFQVLLGPGESVTQTFPCGRYTLKTAEGETWISDEEAFGPDGDYDTTSIFTFEEGGAYEISSGTHGDFHGDSQQGFTG